jgi:predicted nucleotidyltransferase
MNAISCASRTVHLERARQRLLDREQDDLRRNARLQEQAASDAGTIIDMMVRIYRPRRVFQWGSLLRPGAFKPYSDIDIAVEGITDAERFFALLGQAQALTRFPLDVVQMEKIAPEHAEDIRRYGKLVHERE